MQQYLHDYWRYLLEDRDAKWNPPTTTPTPATGPVEESQSSWIGYVLTCLFGWRVLLPLVAMGVVFLSRRWIHHFQVLSLQETNGPLDPHLEPPPPPETEQPEPYRIDQDFVAEMEARKAMEDEEDDNDSLFNENEKDDEETESREAAKETDDAGAEFDAALEAAEDEERRQQLLRIPTLENYALAIPQRLSGWYFVVQTIALVIAVPLMILWSLLVLCVTRPLGASIRFAIRRIRWIRPRISAAQQYLYWDVLHGRTRYHIEERYLGGFVYPLMRDIYDVVFNLKNIAIFVIVLYLVIRIAGYFTPAQEEAPLYFGEDEPSVPEFTIPLGEWIHDGITEWTGEWTTILDDEEESVTTNPESTEFTVGISMVRDVKRTEETTPDHESVTYLSAPVNDETISTPVPTSFITVPYDEKSLAASQTSQVEEVKPSPSSVGGWWYCPMCRQKHCCGIAHG